MKQIQKPWFSFNGIRSDDMGCMLVKQPVIQVASLNAKKVEVAGMDGFITVSDNTYSPVTITQDVAVTDRSKLNGVLNWLRGSGRLVYYDEPSLYWDAVIMTGAKRQSITQRLDGQKFTIQFTCQPFRKSMDEVDIRTATFYGQGNIESRPIVQVLGNGDAVVTINGTRIRLNLTSGVPIYLDCEKKTAYSFERTSSGMVEVYAGQNVYLLDGEWFSLYPADSTRNQVTVDKVGTSFVITPNWRWF